MFRQFTIRATQALALLILPMAAVAQSGRIVGRVTDAQGAAIAGVQLLVSPAGVSSTSGGDGRYIIRGVPAWSGGSAAGSYTAPAGPDATGMILSFFKRVGVLTP